MSFGKARSRSGVESRVSCCVHSTILSLCSSVSFSVPSDSVVKNPAAPLGQLPLLGDSCLALSVAASRNKYGPRSVDYFSSVVAVVAVVVETAEMPHC